MATDSVPGDLQAVINSAREAIGWDPITTVGTKLHGLIPSNGAHPGVIQTIDLEDGQPLPARKRGTVVVFDAASFNQVIADNSDAGDIAIYFDRNPARPSVVAVLNGCGKNGPGWGDFRVNIEFRPTPQWKKWCSHDGQLLDQVSFAEFLEENLDDIAEPDGATMLEIASQLQLVRTVNFQSKVTLQSGTIGFTHTNDDSASVGAGQVAVPQSFVLGVVPIFGFGAYKVPARFRYRISEGKLKLGYKLQRVETLMEKIVDDVVKQVKDGVKPASGGEKPVTDGPNISVLDGLPPPPIC